jgi:hypothetical protein
MATRRLAIALIAHAAFASVNGALDAIPAIKT